MLDDSIARASDTQDMLLWFFSHEIVENAQRVTDDEFRAYGTEVGWFYPSTDIDDKGKDTDHGVQAREDDELGTLLIIPQ